MNSKPDRPITKAVAVLLSVLVFASLFSGVAAAQTGIGGTTVVEEGQTVSEVNAVVGTLVIHGTVTGDVSGAAGTVLITGTVEGDVSVAAGSLEIAGQVGGDVSAGAGSFHLREGGSVGGNVDLGAGDARLDGTIGGDVRVGAETIRLGDTASIAGSLTYDGRLEGNLDAVGGEITRDRTIGGTILPDLQPVASWVFGAYAFVANLLVGAALLVLFPRFSAGLSERVIAAPARTGAIGLGVLIGVPILFVLLALTIVGIPLMLAGILLFLCIAWISLIYGRFAFGVWLVSFFASGDESDRAVDRRWIALVLGLLFGALLAQLPFVGWLVNLTIFVLGLGGLTAGLYARRGDREPS